MPKTKKVNNKNRSVRQTIKTVIFDFGNVLVVDTEKTLELALGLHNLPKWKRDAYEAATHVTERGGKPTEYLLLKIKKLFDLGISSKELEKLILTSQPIKPMWHVLQELRKNYKIAILSNNQKTWPEKMLSGLEKDRSLGGDISRIKFFNSSRIGIRKPQKGIYLFALNKLRAKPSETVFIDDKKSNTVAAGKLGINTIHFTGNMPKLYKELKNFGIKVKM